ncbi:MAG: ATP-binding protein [Elusimicrobiota bacterium]
MKQTLDKFADVLTRVMFGDLHVRAPTDIDEDFSAFSMQLNLLISSLQRKDEEIKTRNAELKSYQERLEALVRERTVELEVSNKHLREQIAECGRTELALRQSQEHLVQAQKMEAVGKLAGGIAHDFNNLLTAILSCAHFLADQIPAGTVAREDVEQIRDAATRAAGLTQQLLAFSRRQKLRTRALDINTIIGDLCKLLRRTLGERIRLEIVTSQDVRSVRGDRTQLEQVLLNLAINARDAMPEGGSLTIETSHSFLSEALSSGRFNVPPGEYVVVSVRDSGSGMDDEALAHIFEPFFTTKEVGKGTGLGLATVYGIVAQSGGHIVVESEQGKGAAFKVYLPYLAEPSAEPKAIEFVEEMTSGAETILVVEDESLVRRTVDRILRGEGYEVLVAECGEEALRLAAEYKRRIHLLLSDVVMPGLSGPEVARKLSAIRPDMLTLFMSGYPRGSDGKEDFAGLGGRLLMKPFSPDDLARRVRKTLDDALDRAPDPC